MADSQGSESIVAPVARRRVGIVVVLVVIVLMAIVAAVLFMFLHGVFGLAWSWAIAVSCSLAVPYLVRYVQRGHRALYADLSDDGVFRAQVHGVRRMRLWGVALILLIALAFGGAQAARVFQPDRFFSYKEAIDNLDQSRKDFDAARQPGAYQARVDEYKKAGISQDEFDAMEFGADKLAFARSIVNPLASGGIVFWGALLSGLILLGGLEVGATAFGLGGDIADIGDEICQQQAAGSGPRLDEPPVPEDIARLVERVGNSRAAHVRSFWDFDLKGAGRTDAMGKLVQSVGLTHVRLGGIAFVCFVLWVVLSLVGVTQNLVE